LSWEYTIQQKERLLIRTGSGAVPAQYADLDGLKVTSAHLTTSGCSLTGEAAHT